jgi:hypothetical protein
VRTSETDAPTTQRVDVRRRGCICAYDGPNVFTPAPPTACRAAGCHRGLATPARADTARRARTTHVCAAQNARVRSRRLASSRAQLRLCGRGCLQPKHDARLDLGELAADVDEPRDAHAHRVAWRVLVDGAEEVRVRIDRIACARAQQQQQQQIQQRRRAGRVEWAARRRLAGVLARERRVRRVGGKNACAARRREGRVCGAAAACGRVRRSGASGS